MGFVGSSGTTSLSHLHFDFKSIPNQWGNTTTAKYLNPNRLFDPTEHPHILTKLDNAHIEILHDWSDSTLFRIHWPHNQHINRFEFTNGTYNLVYDVEEVRASYSSLSLPYGSGQHENISLSNEWLSNSSILSTK